MRPCSTYGWSIVYIILFFERAEFWERWCLVIFPMTDPTRLNFDMAHSMRHVRLQNDGPVLRFLSVQIQWNTSAYLFDREVLGENINVNRKERTSTFAISIQDIPISTVQGI